MKKILLIMSVLTTGTLAAQTPPARKVLLQQALPGISVETVKMDEITFAPGQAAPVHHHPCEVYGYVVSGQILYQPAGEPAQLLHAGDSFREAAGREISVFKNAQNDQPATFIAVYLLRKDQPSIIINK
ncbi:cupin domain-containing protein [Chitinophaga ginsengisegetis]|uniref:cupin domain-containing protein n=1 Tax=Chitinophaga ginsengisegetis TaxID=393003 RepID=UPI000DB93034|nr:cupin domain-containing protein [Chitinophaga ginsengisegetis]MDR6567345.1 quercetin dioxygenase-like cupin family protein [Chitinophaga ginsengisegetis]MDR6647076.1 quercetin dioxygenase-like cupin family protein [Chitinophaga ginsengisegetis]MDR6653425.1 quercetin dioxygenase-like cupin family protein [Chitinophaga ginsengisegetis]